MTTELRDSLQTILDNYLPDEEKHYQQNHCPGDHIRNNLLDLKEFLEKTDKADGRQPS